MSYRSVNDTCGLYSGSTRLPLLSVGVEGHIRSDFACSVKLTQSFMVESSSNHVHLQVVDADKNTLQFKKNGKKIEWYKNGTRELANVTRFEFDCESGKYENASSEGLVPEAAKLKFAGQLKWFFETMKKPHFLDLVNEPEGFEPIPNKQKVEASYYFPLEGNAAVYDFRATLPDGTIVKGEVQEKKQAKQTYQAAKAKGQTAFLMEREKSDVFQITVGNVDAGEVVKIEMSYIAELNMRDGKIRVRIPNRICPKYGGGPSTYVDYPISFNFLVNTSTDIKGIEVLNEKEGFDVNETFLNGTTRRIVAAKTGSCMNEDFVMYVEQDCPYGVYTTLESSSELKSECLRMTWNNYLSEDQEMQGPCEMIFLVDKSGSMNSHSRMDTAKFALNLFLRSLPENSKFNIVMFDSTFRTLFSNGSQLYDDTSVERAQQFVQRTHASGGTNIAMPLRQVLEHMPEDEDYPRSIILLTDGEVRDTETCINLSRRGGCPIYTIGVGESFSQELVEGVAEASNATWLAVRDTKDMGSVVIQLLSNALSPVVTKCKVDLGPFENAVMWPDKFPNLRAGTRTSVYWTRPIDGEMMLPEDFPIKLSGYLGDGSTFEKELHVITSDFEGITESQKGRSKMEFDMLIHRVAAMMRIKKLEKKSLTASIKKEIRELGLKFNLATSETSFVAVRSNGDDTPGETLVVGEPVYKKKAVLDTDLFNIGGRARCSAPLRSNVSSSYTFASAPMPMMMGSVMNMTNKRKRRTKSANKSYAKKSSPMESARMSARAPSFGGVACMFSDTADKFDDVAVLEQSEMLSNELPNFMDISMECEEEDSCDEDDEDELMRLITPGASNAVTPKVDFNWLISQQKTSGRFALDLTDSRFLKYKPQAALKAMEAMQDILDVEDVCATLLALLVLEVEFSSRRTEWNLMKVKSERFVKKKISSHNISDLLSLFQQ